MKTECGEENQTETEGKPGAFGVPNDDYVELSVEEQERLIEYNNSVEAMEQARGRCILFQEAPPETLPFIVYSISVSANAFSAMALMITVTGFLWQIAVLVGLAMVLPILALPSGSFSDTAAWVRNLVSFEKG